MPFCILLKWKKGGYHRVKCHSWVSWVKNFLGMKEVGYYVAILCCALSRVSWVWLCKLMDRSPQGSSIHRILQVRILKSVAVPFSRGSSWPRNQTCVSCVSALQADSLPTEPPEETHVAILALPCFKLPHGTRRNILS